MLRAARIRRGLVGRRGSAAASDSEAAQVDRSMFASLKLRDYRLLWSGMVGSAFAMNMQIVAQGWLVYEMTSSPVKLAWVSLASTLPQIFLSLVGGVLADRSRKREIILIGQAINGIISFFMAVIIITGHVQFWHFIWVGLVNGSMNALSIPARNSFIPYIVGEPLMFNAMAFNTTAWNISRIFGPVVAGLMIDLLSGGDTTSHFAVGIVYFVLSGLYFVASATVMSMHHTGKTRRRRSMGVMREVTAGVRYAQRSPVIGGLILLTIASFVFGAPVQTLIIPFARDVLSGGADDLGLLLAAMGVGAIAGSLTLSKLGGLRRKGFWLFFTLFLWGFALIGIALSSTDFWAMATVGAVGFISAVGMSMNRTIVVLQSSPRMRGRIMSIDMMTHGLMPLGVLPISYVAETVSIQVGLGLCGVLFIGTTLVLWYALGAVRNIDRGFGSGTGS